MDFIITSCDTSICPKCKNKLSSIRSNNVLKLVCSCGYLDIPNKQNNVVNIKDIETR